MTGEKIAGALGTYSFRRCGTDGCGNVQQTLYATPDARKEIAGLLEETTATNTCVFGMDRLCGEVTSKAAAQHALLTRLDSARGHFIYTGVRNEIAPVITREHVRVFREALEAQSANKLFSVEEMEAAGIALIHHPLFSGAGLGHFQERVCYLEAGVIASCTDVPRLVIRQDDVGWLGFVPAPVEEKQPEESPRSNKPDCCPAPVCTVAPARSSREIHFIRQGRNSLVD